MDGVGKLQNKAPPINWERNKESCERESWLVVVPRIVEIVPVHVGLINVAVEIRHVEIAIVVPDERIHHHLFHHPLKDRCRAQD